MARFASILALFCAILALSSAAVVVRQDVDPENEASEAVDEILQAAEDAGIDVDTSAPVFEDQPDPEATSVPEEIESSEETGPSEGTDPVVVEATTAPEDFEGDDAVASETGAPTDVEDAVISTPFPEPEADLVPEETVEDIVVDPIEEFVPEVSEEPRDVEIPELSDEPLAEESPEPSEEEDEDAEPSESPDDLEDEEASESPEESDGSVCFPADATVKTESGDVKRMDELTIGDRVEVADGTFSDVFMFTHRMSDVRYMFVRLETTSGATLQLTRGHYLYVNGALAAAKTVKAGDVLALADGTETSVARVSTAINTGLYNPQTVHGDVVVNGIRASTYTTAVQPVLAHGILAPLRVMYEAFGWTMVSLDKGADEIARVVPSGVAAY